MTLLGIDDDDDETTQSAPPSGPSPDGPVHVTRELDCVLNDIEIKERGEEMAKCEREAKRLAERRKALNMQIRAQTDRMTVLAIAINTGEEVRDVPCTWRPDYKDKRWDLVRDDTGDVHDSRPMTSVDLQTRLPIESAAEVAAAEDDDEDAGDPLDLLPPAQNISEALDRGSVPRTPARPTKPSGLKRKTKAANTNSKPSKKRR